MSMADDHTLRSHRSNDPYRRGTEPSRPNAQASSDPLAELARLIGQSDPFAEFGRNNSRQTQHETHAAPATAQDDWQNAQAPDQRYGDDGSRGRDFASAHEPRAPSRRAESRPYADEMRLGASQHEPPYPDERMHAGDQQRGHEADDHYQDDVPLAPDEDAMYDDAPRTRRYGSLATALALIGCAMLGTAGAYGYRSYYNHSDPAQPPPVITADNSTPTKIVPTTPIDPQSNKVIQDRLAPAKKEQVISKQEEPVALKELGTQAAPRVVLPAPVARVEAGSAPWPPASSASTPAAGSNEPKRVRTVTIRPDGTDVSGRPAGAPPPTALQSPANANARQITPPAPRAAAPARSGSGSVSLEPQASPSDPGAAPAGRSRTAAAPLPPTRTAPETSTSGGFVVQLSSQKTDGEARSSFRSLQAKFPNELGDRQPIIRRADLGSKGVYYRTMVGPFASAQEASKFCASYKSAGGQCMVPSN